MSCRRETIGRRQLHPSCDSSDPGLTAASISASGPKAGVLVYHPRMSDTQLQENLAEAFKKVSIDNQILISLEARHAENILNGRKLVEFRRRKMNVVPGATIWFYAKLPVGSIVGCATVTAVHTHAPSTLWRKFAAVSGISRGDFFSYFDGIAQGTALELSNCVRLNASVSLESLRRFCTGFQPPQFFARLRQERQCWQQSRKPPLHPWLSTPSHPSAQTAHPRSSS